MIMMWGKPYNYKKKHNNNKFNIFGPINTAPGDYSSHSPDDASIAGNISSLLLLCFFVKHNLGYPFIVRFFYLYCCHLCITI
jgi:hypothetical protein